MGEKGNVEVTSNQFCFPGLLRAERSRAQGEERVQAGRNLKQGPTRPSHGLSFPQIDKPRLADFRGALYEQAKEMCIYRAPYWCRRGVSPLSPWRLHESPGHHDPYLLPFQVFWGRIRWGTHFSKNVYCSHLIDKETEAQSGRGLT